MKRYVYVGGIDFDFKRVNFFQYCDNRMNRQINGNSKKEDLFFQSFDIRTGEKTVTNVIYAKGTKKTVKKTDKFRTELTKADYDPHLDAQGQVHYSLKPNLTDRMSILDIYKAIRNIGDGDPGTLMEFSIFSHSYQGGPILTNSRDHDPSAGGRDPNDFDPRGAKDFIPPTMNEKELMAFQKAFNPKAISWIWGCTATQVYHDTLAALERHRDYRDKGVDDEKLFVLKNVKGQQLALFVNRLGSLVNYSPKTLEVSVKFKALKYLMLRGLADCYVQRLATVTGGPAFGSPVGCGANHDGGPLPLMRVEPTAHRHLAFYKNYLGIQFDPEGRGYAKFLPNLNIVPPGP
jgi:hypothetical protein